MLDLDYDYASCTKNSEKVSWKLDDVLAPSAKLDFSRPFMPEALSCAGTLGFLSAAERIKLNQLGANAYAHLFVFVEEYILAATVKQAQAEMYGDHGAIRALLRFAEEEAKHQELFLRFRALFEKSFGACELLPGSKDVAGVILSKSPLAVMLVTLHLELVTQLHYTESVRDQSGIEPLFANMLKHHWVEESQHARIDALEIQKLAKSASPEAVALAFDEYLGLLEAFDGLLAEQGKLDAKSAPRALGRSLTDDQTAQIAKAQHLAYRRGFLLTGMNNPRFLDMAKKLSADGAAKIVARAVALAG